jgi:uncharacterized UPF0160 family protein
MQQQKRLRSTNQVYDALVRTIEDTPVQSSSAEGCILTHSGVFQCDEALACALLKVLPACRTMPICRSRTQAFFDVAGIVVDVGGKYDPETMRFDHHQNGFNETFSEKETIKLSSAGLVYKHYGKLIISNLFPSLAEGQLEVLYRKMYGKLLREVDGVDNGVPLQEGGEVTYAIKTGLSRRVNALVPNAMAVVHHVGHHLGLNIPSLGEIEALQNLRFKEAMELTIFEFCDTLQFLVDEWLPAKEAVEQAYLARFQIDPSGRVMVLSSSVPWKTHLQELEDGEQVAYVVFPDGATWKVQGVPLVRNGFPVRVPLKWTGLRDEELCVASGIPGCVFVHGSGFIGGNVTKEGAVQMAMSSVNAS